MAVAPKLLRSRPLAGKRILVAEDLYLLADAVVETLTDAGAVILGPFPSRAAVRTCIEREHVDAAVLDIGLNDGYVFPAAEELARRGIPFLFLTGYDASVIPNKFGNAPWLLKPAAMTRMCAELAHMLKAGSTDLPAGDPGRT